MIEKIESPDLIDNKISPSMKQNSIAEAFSPRSK